MRSETTRSYYERMNVVLRHIQQHLDNDLTPAEVAAVANFSPSHFHRVFKGMLGESLKEHVRRLRLERSALQLEMTDRPVTDIGLDAGFETLESYSRAFRKMFGQPPSTYRTEKRKSRWASVSSGVHYLPEDARTGLTVSPRSKAMEMDIKKIDPVRVAYLRHIGPYEECEQTWEKLCAWAGPKGLLTEQTLFYSLCHDDPKVTPADKIRMDACITVSEALEPEGEIGVMDIFGSEFAVSMHKGPYDGLAARYEQMFGMALPQSGHEYAEGPSVEQYLNSPKFTAPEDLLTAIHIPLK